MSSLWQRWLKLAPAPSASPAERRPLAAAVLLLECARADAQEDQAELEEVRAALARDFGLSADELHSVLEEAGRHSRDAVSLHDYLTTLNRELSAGDKRQLMESLWRVAYADGRLDPHEEATLRKLADLLFVPHRDYIAAKLAVVDAG